MKPNVQIVAGSAKLYQVAAAEFVSAASEAVHKNGVFTVALAGGSTPKGLYSLLATDPHLQAEVPWKKILFFFGDERHVPPDHSDSNYRMASETMRSKVPIDSTQVFRVKGEYKDAAKAAAEYEKALQESFHITPGRLPCIDLVMLGMGQKDTQLRSRARRRSTNYSN